MTFCQHQPSDKITSSKSKTFIAFCFCFILGAGVFSFANTNKSTFSLYLLLFIILFLLILLWNRRKQRFLLSCLLLFVFGGIRFLISIPNHDSSRIEFYNGRKVTLQGWISAEPDIGVSDARYIVSVTGLEGQFVIPTVRLGGEESLTPDERDPSATYARDDKTPEPVSGKIAIKTRIYPEYSYGEKLSITCSLLEPENFIDSNFNYKKYLAKQGVWSVCASPVIQSSGKNSGNVFIKIMLQLKNKIKSQMASLWPEPDNSLMAGLLYGSRKGLPQELVDNFSRTGVSHIMAVSGYNVSILAVALNIILIYIGFFRRQSFWFLISLILAFVFFTGATASVVRAGVMAVIILISQYIGRLSAVGRVLIYAAVIMLLLNPYLLIWDAGFQLSFLSTLGLVYLSPIIQSFVDNKMLQRRVSKVGTRHDFVKSKNNFLLVVVQIFITTISAIIATMPLVIYQFERFSIAAPLVNVLILWLVPWLMLFGFVSLIFSWLFFPLGQAVAWVAGFGLRYVIIIVDWFGNKSWSAVNIQISVWLMLIMYGLLVYVIARSGFKKKCHAELVSASIKNSGQILK